jgi:hypothetical protein
MLLLILQIAIPPLGSHPRTWALYRQNIHTDTGTFTCLDGSSTLPLASLNDGFVDCADGSDEPTTGADANSTFYCVNERLKPQKIKGWSVGDGICDCYDGSDESLNARANCPNTCPALADRRRRLVDQIADKYRRAREGRSRLEMAGAAFMEQAAEPSALVRIPLGLLSRVAGRLQPGDDAALPAVPEWAAGVAWVWQRTFNARASRRPFVFVARGSLARDLQRLQEGLEKRLGSKRAMLEAMKRAPLAAATLYAKKFRSGEFKLSFLKRIRQNAILVGKFANISGSVMLFDGGEHCWATDRPRAFRMELVCSDENEFVSTKEPTTCVYEGVFATPIVCTDEKDVESLKLKNLEQLAASLKISV